MKSEHDCGQFCKRVRTWLLGAHCAHHSLSFFYACIIPLWYTIYRMMNICLPIQDSNRSRWDEEKKRNAWKMWIHMYILWMSSYCVKKIKTKGNHKLNQCRDLMCSSCFAWLISSSLFRWTILISGDQIQTHHFGCTTFVLNYFIVINSEFFDSSTEYEYESPGKYFSFLYSFFFFFFAWISYADCRRVTIQTYIRWYPCVQLEKTRLSHLFHVFETHKHVIRIAVIKTKRKR